MSIHNPQRDPNIKTIGDLFVRNAKIFEQEEAVVYENLRLTWGEVNNRANRLANALLKQGLQKGDRVAVLNVNNHIWPEAHGGIAKAGGIIVPVNNRLSPLEWEKVLQDSGARSLLVEKNFLPGILEVRTRLPELKEIICIGETEKDVPNYETFLSESSEHEPESRHDVKEDDIHAIVYTGGTTGIPKGAMWLHHRTLDFCYFAPYPIELSYCGRILIFTPAYTGGVTSVLLCGIYGGARMVFMDFDPVKVLETYEKEKIEFSPGIPVMLRMMIEAAGDRTYDLRSLKRIYYGAAPISIPLLKKAMDFFGCELVQAYGMTENTGATMTQLDPHDHVAEGHPRKTARLASAGRAIKGLDVRIFDERDMELPRGEVGEIVFKSIGLMAGYWNKPEETERAMRGGWFHSGDMGWMDEEGYLFIVDRKNFMIITGGFNVYPTEVEAILLKHEDILETSVLGVEDPTWGEKVVATVHLKEGKETSTEDIRLFCKKHLAGYKVPKEVILVKDPLPRNHFGKILRNEIKKIYDSVH